MRPGRAATGWASSSSSSSSWTSSRSCSSHRSPRKASRARRAPIPCASSTAPWSSRRPTSSRPSTAVPSIADSGLVITFQPSLTNTMLTMFIVTAVLLVLMLIFSRGRAPIPGRVQNFIEWGLESLDNFAHGHGRRAGPPVRPHVRVLLRAHPRLQLERPGAARRAYRGAPGAHERRERDHRPGARRLHHVRGRGLPPARRRRLPGQVLPVLRVQERHRCRCHRPLRGPRGAAARVRQAADALDATLRQHLRR